MKTFEIVGEKYVLAIDAQAEIDRLTISHRRYETLRTLNPRQFADLYAESLKGGVPFDESVDKIWSSRSLTQLH